MPDIVFKCKILTPMFIGGALPMDCELRAPAIKGALRYWWRAMHGHLSTAELKRKEAKVFGSPDKMHGKSKVIVQVTHALNSSTVHLPSRNVMTQMYEETEKGNQNIDIIKYLRYGVESKPYLQPGGVFEVKLRITDTSLVNEVKEAFVLVASFGGLGAKSRNGFGRFQITRCTETLSESIQIIRTTRNNRGGPYTYTSISQQTTLFTTNRLTDSWDRCLHQLGRAYKLSMENLGDEPHDVFARRLLVAPIGRSGDNNKVSFRHAKTCFMGIIKEKEGYRGYILSLPYQYLQGADLDGLSNVEIQELQRHYDTYDVNGIMYKFHANLSNQLQAVSL